MVQDESSEKMFDSDNDDNIDYLDQEDIIPSDGGTLQNLTYMVFNTFSKIFRRSSNYYLNQTNNVIYNSACVFRNLAACFIYSFGQKQ